MKKSFLLSAFLFSFAINAQTGRVGINTENPKATLHIEASASDPNVLDGVIPPKLLGNELKLKNYTIDQKGAIVFITAIPDSLSGQVIEMNSPGFYYFDGLIWKSFNGSHNLEDVVSKGNYSPNFITFIGSSDSPLRDGAIGMNPNTYSMYFGNMNPAHSGYYNIGFGYNTFPSITTGGYNSAFGHSSGSSLTTAEYSAFFGYMSGTKTTTGNGNSFFGDESAFNNTTGHKNSFFGLSSGYHNMSGSYNSIFGYKGGSMRTIGDFNVLFGNFAGGNSKIIKPLGSNNVLIGSAAGFDDENLNNKLIIHSNNSLTSSNSNSLSIEGIFSDPNQSKLANALVTGDFQERWFKLNGNFRLNPTLNPSDATYTQVLVAKPDGTVGITDQSDHLTTAGTQPNKPIYGQLEYAGGDTVGYPEAYGLYSENDTSVTGFTIQDDGALTPSMYFLDKSKGNEVTTQIFMSTEGIHLISNGLYGSIDNAIPNRNTSLVQKLWVENLVNSKLTVPAPPTVGNYTLTAVNGVMQWVAN